MQVNKDWVSRNFFALNDRFFNGTLPTPQFFVNRSTSYLGECAFHYKRNIFGHCPRPISYAITISNHYSRNEGDFLNTLLHEMIHLYFYYIGEYNVGHGQEFQKMARTFDKYGFNVQTCNDVCTNLRPYIYGSLRGKCENITANHQFLTFFNWTLSLITLYAFITNKDAMRVILYLSQQAATHCYETATRLWVEYDMTNRIAQTVYNLFEFLNQL